MPGRKYLAGSGYRYGFNGKENDNEVKGEGGQQDYGMRIYDPRLGKFLSVDPITAEYSELTPYQFASNRPIDGIDLDGLEYVKFWDNPLHWFATFGEGWSKGKGGAYELADDVNRNVNPVGIAGHGLYSTVTGKDLITRQPVNRGKAFSDMGAKLIMTAAGLRLPGPGTAATQLEKQMAVNRAAVGMLSTSTALKVPQGLSNEEFKVMSQRIINRVGNISDDIVVQGSRASGNASTTSDIDIAIKVGNDQFNKMITQYFGNPNPGSAFERTMQHAMKTGKIQSGEAGLSSLRKNLETLLGMKVDVSIIRTGGQFDNGAQIPITGIKTQ